METVIAGVAAAVGLAAAGVFLVTQRKRSRGARRSGGDAFDILGTDAKSALARVAPPPVPLDQPIASEAAWEAIRRHAGDAAYRDAVDQVRGRYRFANPMLLPNTLRSTMDKSGTNFREAMIAVAKDDALR